MREQPADSGAEQKAEPECGPHHTVTARAVLRRRRIGDVGLRHGRVAGHGAREGARDEQ